MEDSSSVFDLGGMKWWDKDIQERRERKESLKKNWRKEDKGGRG